MSLVLIFRQNLGDAPEPPEVLYYTFAEWIYNQPGLTGTVNDRLKAYLNSLGYSGQINEMMFKWLTGLGYSQATLPEKLYAWGLVNLLH